MKDVCAIPRRVLPVCDKDRWRIPGLDCVAFGGRMVVKERCLRRKPHRLAHGRVTSAATRQEGCASHCNLNGLTTYSSVVRASCDMGR